MDTLDLTNLPPVSVPEPLKKLTRKQTVEDNSRFFSPDEFQPKLAITMGIGTDSWKPGVFFSLPPEKTRQKRFTI